MSKKNIVHTTPPDDEILASKIYMIRKQKVMLDRDLANLYGVETRALKQAVRRNIDRFPEDFMFEMSGEEFGDWRSQFVTSNSDKLGLRYAPFCFTEQGVAMLSSVLNSKLAIQINIQIMRIFTRMRQLLADNTEVKLEIAEIRYTVEQIAKKQKGHDQNIELLFEYIDRLQEKQDSAVAKRRSKVEIGFKVGGNGKD